jgi:hypothetical protein
MQHVHIATVARTAVILAVAGAFGLGMSRPVSAEIGANIHDKTYGEWSAEWWQWQAANFPDFEFGEGLVDCSAGQSGPVWFLAGTDGGSAERECMEPLTGHKHLFIPLVNANVNDLPPTIEERRDLLDGLFSEVPAGIINSVACDLQIDVDGTPAVYSTPIVRTQSPPFEYFGDPETVSDGYWVMLDPLPSGEHTIMFSGGLCDIDSGENLFHVDVTYTVMVK